MPSSTPSRRLARYDIHVRQELVSDEHVRRPSLLANRGFTAGLLLGLAFFAAVNGLAYVISPFFQTALGLKPAAAAIALGPLMVGIIIASVVCRPLIGTLGRVLVITGLGITLAGAAGRWATVLAAGTAVSVWAMAPRSSFSAPAGHAMTVSVAVVGAIALLCLGLVWLLPKSAPQEQHQARPLPRNWQQAGRRREQIDGYQTSGTRRLCCEA